MGQIFFQNTLNTAAYTNILEQLPEQLTDHKLEHCGRWGRQYTIHHTRPCAVRPTNFLNSIIQNVSTMLVLSTPNLAKHYETQQKNTVGVCIPKDLTFQCWQPSFYKTHF